MELLKYPGSKALIADKIISLFPDNYKNMTYLEPFFGSGVVFFKKNPSVIETINDLSGDVYNLFYQIRENGEELARLIEYTPWSRQEKENTYEKSDSEIENARRFLIRCWFSIGLYNIHKSGWRNVTNKSGSHERYFQLPEKIIEIAYRLKTKPGNQVQIDNVDAFTLIEKYNREYVLMYLDPPYVLSTRKNKKYYSHEMTDEDHIRLCELINKSKAKIILSGYENEIYESYLKNFKKTNISSFDTRGNKRTEVIWTNYSATKELFDEE